jgi:hypothetical protein
VHLEAGDGPRRATRQVRARLADGSHWAVRSVARAALAADGARTGERLLGRSVGLFSNLGAWTSRGLAEPGAWLAGPPPVRFLPLAASVVTVDGSLGMMLTAYPGLTLRRATVSEWLDAWVGRLGAQEDRVPRAIRRRNIRIVRAR